MITLFWICILLVFYAYLGYALVLYLLVKIKESILGKQQANPDYLPSVSLIVPCFNEDGYVLEKVRNSKALQYPKDKLQLIFISDGSDDQTAAMLSNVSDILHLHEPERRGKAAAMNRAVGFAQNEILVFCDANTELNPEALLAMMPFYENPKTGGVSGEKKIKTTDKTGASSAGEGIYWKYESFLKSYDARLYSIVGAAGELMSYRKSLYTELEPDTLLDDFMQSMRIAARGYTIQYTKNAVATETASANVKEELKRKIRICAGGWQSMTRLWKVLIPWPYPLLTFCYISHRVLRWSLAAFALPIILLLNIYLVLSGESIWYTLMLMAQVIFYALSFLGWYLENKDARIKALYIPYYFLIMNIAVFFGLNRYIKGSQSALWERAKRA